MSSVDFLSIHDHGIVRLRDSMGSDLTVVDAAKVSFDKRAKNLGEKEIRILEFLAREKHTSPFRHQIVQFEVYCPLMVARQWWKYRIGSAVNEEPEFDSMEAWNESSRRYITEHETFYVPEIFRSAPKNKKQGSGEPVNEELNTVLREHLMNYIDEGMELYKFSLDSGVCAEQARLFLPAYGLYIRFIWTTSLLGLLHFLVQRLADDAQVEIQDYAKACASLAKPLFPQTFRIFDIQI